MAAEPSTDVLSENSSSIDDVGPTPKVLPTRSEQDALLDFDSNPRSPKRRRISPSEEKEKVDPVPKTIDQNVNSKALPTNAASSKRLVSGPPAGATSQNVVPPVRNIPLGPSKRIKVEGLPVLDNLATQVLSTLAKLTNTEIGEMLFGPSSQRGQEYKNLKSRFDQTKGIYAVNSPFLSPTSLDLTEQHQVDILRKANTTTFMASVFSGEIGLRVMDLNFMDVFVPENGKLLKAHGSIYLELKTQAFIAARRTAAVSPLQVMLDLFPADMDRQMLVKRNGSKTLAPSEVDFLNRFVSRRDILYSDIKNNNLDNLHERYRWDDFSREVSTYLSKNLEVIVHGGREKVESSGANETKPQIPQGQMESQFAVQPVIQPPTQSSTSTVNVPQPPALVNLDDDDFVAQAARAAAIALQGSMDFMSPPTQVTRTPPPTSNHAATLPEPLRANIQKSPQIDTLPSTVFQHVNPATVAPTSVGLSTPIPQSDVPHSSQTAPTQVLYERARIASTNKASPTGRKVPAPSHRRPWTQEEENALMTGLDRVKGPHWSQILAMYGPGGTINESLKDRNQVQLKDKARNLKLFFLKAGIEVPYYLQYVTGDLRTRAPGQAEKREARERERQHEGGDKGVEDGFQETAEFGATELESTLSTPNAEQDFLEDEDDDFAPEADIENQNDAFGGTTGFDFDALAASAAAEVVQELDSSIWHPR